MAQNIIRYSDERLAQGGIGTVAIGHTSEGFVVEAINPMKSDNMLSLKENLDKLQKMQPKDLRKAYKQRLREGPPEGSKGAGLGFIEIARKSSKFEFDFVESPELLFVLKAWIDP